SANRTPNGRRIRANTMTCTMPHNHVSSACEIIKCLHFNYATSFREGVLVHVPQRETVVFEDGEAPE
ncbi:hypothetical protein EVAR_92793_1, partial [Eumeta japonica]